MPSKRKKKFWKTNEAMVGPYLGAVTDQQDPNRVIVVVFVINDDDDDNNNIFFP
jgi:hypothetical protein